MHVGAGQATFQSFHQKPRSACTYTAVPVHKANECLILRHISNLVLQVCQCNTRACTAERVEPDKVELELPNFEVQRGNSDSTTQRARTQCFFPRRSTTSAS